MDQLNEYKLLLVLRASDKAASVTAKNPDYGDPVVDSGTWELAKDRFEAGSKTMKALGAVAVFAGQVEAVPVAIAGAALMDLGAEVAKQEAEKAKAKERAANERRAAEKQMNDHVERNMHEQRERLSRGDYRDPPTREQMDRSSSIA
jgi:hypothetical protein